MWLQALTTREPDDSMIEVAIASVEAVFDWRKFIEKENRKKNRKKNKKQSEAVKSETEPKEIEAAAAAEFATAAEADAYLPYRSMLGATHASAAGFTTVSMAALYGQEFYGVASTVFDPVKLFNTLSGSLTTYGVMNAAGFKMDFTGMFFPKVWFDVTMIEMYFGETTYPGHFDVYVSHNPIETAADLQNAVKIGSSKGAGKAQELYATNQETSSKEPMKFDVPSEYWGESYVYIVSTADYTGSFSGETSFGVVVFGYGVEVTVPKTEE
jgi:hypothetical protein